jgi:hypothetical protein
VLDGILLDRRIERQRASDGMPLELAMMIG